MQKLLIAIISFLTTFGAAVATYFLAKKEDKVQSLQQELKANEVVKTVEVELAALSDDELAGRLRKRKYTKRRAAV